MFRDLQFVNFPIRQAPEDFGCDFDGHFDQTLIYGDESLHGKHHQNQFMWLVAVGGESGVRVVARLGARSPVEMDVSSILNMSGSTSLEPAYSVVPVGGHDTLQSSRIPCRLRR